MSVGTGFPAWLLQRAVPVTALNPAAAAEGQFYFLRGQGPGVGQLWLAVKNLTGVIEFVFIAAGTSGAAPQTPRTVAGLTSVADTAAREAGQFLVTPDMQIAGLRLTLRVVLSVQDGSPNVATVQLRNLTDGVYVEIGGAGVTTRTTSSALPVVIVSVPLDTAVGFSFASKVYQVEVASSSLGVAATLGIAETLYAPP